MQGASYDLESSRHIINEPVTFALVCERPRRMLQSLPSTVKYILTYRLSNEVNLFVTARKQVVNPDPNVRGRMNSFCSSGKMVVLIRIVFQTSTIF